MVKHSPTPWVFEDEYVRDCGGDIVADVYVQPTADAGESMEANAEHIVRCVNLHDELVEAMELVIERGPPLGDKRLDGHDHVKIYPLFESSEWQALRDTLTKAKETQCTN